MRERKQRRGKGREKGSEGEGRGERKEAKERKGEIWGEKVYILWYGPALLQ